MTEIGNAIELRKDREELFPLTVEHMIFRNAWRKVGAGVPVEIRASSDYTRIAWALNPSEKRKMEYPVLLRRVKTPLNLWEPWLYP